MNKSVPLFIRKVIL